MSKYLNAIAKLCIVWLKNCQGPLNILFFLQTHKTPEIVQTRIAENVTNGIKIDLHDESQWKKLI